MKRMIGYKIFITLDVQLFYYRPCLVDHLPAKSEVEVPLTYGDYNFIEALMRYMNWYLKKQWELFLECSHC